MLMCEYSDFQEHYQSKQAFVLIAGFGYHYNDKSDQNETIYRPIYHFLDMYFNTGGDKGNPGEARKHYYFLEEPGFRIMKTTAATQMTIPTTILPVKASPYTSVPIRMAVSGSNTRSTAVLVGPI